MTLAPPDPAALRAYLQGTLAAEEAEAIRKWLIVAATPEVLEMLDDMATEIEHARARLAYWAGQPLRARLARLAWRARCVIGHSFELDLDHRAPLAGTLGGQRAEVRASGPRRKLTTSPGETREVLVRLAEATWFGVYAVERSGSLIVLAPGSTRHAAGARIEAGGLVVDEDDVSLDVFVVFDPQGPLPAAPPNVNAVWLAALLDPAADGSPTGRSVLWTTLETSAVVSAEDPEERLPVSRDLESEPVMGIITALPKEYAAVHAMLDEPVDISRGVRGQHKYVAGNIRGNDGGAHPVVLALLPTMGNNSATQRATLLLEHFPSVRNLLMVGIAGGAPDPARAEDHVRLGDVVVSGSHGIVQYDYVAETIAETMHRHPPRPPSASLLEAVNILAAHELSGQRPWLAHMKRAAAIRDSARPDEATDVLLATPPGDGAVAHPHDPARRPNEPRVFVGVIGSANILVRNPQLRDRMRDKFKIRAFEMEGSGIADASWGLEVGYLAIRGICDYCDSAKNDTWQNYAAVAAAAYMRALLESLPAPRKDKPLSGASSPNVLNIGSQIGTQNIVYGNQTIIAAPSAEIDALTLTHKAQGLVRPSRDGDQFHYHWAARQCLRLLPGETDLVAVTIEGPSTAEAASDAITEGEELIDVGFYYGAEGRERARLVHYVQLKHSTRHAREPWTASGLQNTLDGFAQRYMKLLDRFPADDVAQRFRFEFASNRPIDSKVREALADLASGAVARHSEAQQLLVRYSGLTGARVQKFFRLFVVTGGEGDLWEQRYRLAQDLSQYLAGADSETPIELKELVTRKATTEFEADPSIRRHDVLRALKADEKDLAPAPCLLPDPEDTLPREQEQDILRTLLDATTPVIIHADGGMGKSVLAARLAASMPTNSEAVLYDCFGDGLYRNALGFRHRHRDALVQIANELAARGLCYPLVPTPHADARQYMRAFLGRLMQAADSLRAKDSNAKLCLIVDAADNAEMAAAEQREPGSFVRDLIRAPLPEGVRVAFTCRSHRRSMLHAPTQTQEIALLPFSQAESARHLRTRYPDASDAEASEFAYLSSSNPRVQAFALRRSTSLEEMLKQLGPEPTTVESAIETLLNGAFARLKDASSGVEAQHIDMICRGLAVFRPLVPVPVLAKVSGTSDGAVRSFVLDLEGRPLFLKGESIHFLDEPTETWFRERFGPDTTDLATFVDRLRPLIAESAYAAAALPQLLLQLGRFDELVELALSDEGLPSANPLEERDVKLQRLRFALKASIQRGHYVAAAKLALKAGGECAGEQRQNQVIKAHTDVASILMAPDRIESLVARRTFGDSWRGSHYAYDAGLMSGRPEYSAEASSRLRMAKDWLSAWARQPKDPRQHHEDVSDEDLAEIAIAMLRLEGANVAARFLKIWRPRSVSFRVGRHVGRRLIDLGEYEQLNALANAAERDPWLLLGLCVETNAVGRLLPAASLTRLMRFLQSPGVKLPDPGWNESWRILDAVRSAIEQALSSLPHQPEGWAEVLRRYLPVVPPESISIRYGTDRARLWRAYALEAALRSERVSLEAVTPAGVREQQSRGRRTSEGELFLAEARGLLVWFSLSAEVACGRHPPDIAKAIENALKETVDAERLMYQEQKPARKHVALEWLRILRSAPGAQNDQTAALSSWITGQEHRLPVDTVIDLSRLAARRDGFDRLAMELSEHVYSILDSSRENAESRADSLLRLARAVLPVSREEARAYFDRAVEIASRIGDENLERWVALLDLATVAAEPEVPRPRTAYRLSRIAELTYEYVERDKHFPWHSTVEALVDLCATSAFAILSRWRDRRFGNSDRLLPIAVERLVKRQLLPEHTPVALAGITAWWERAKDLRRALSAEKDPRMRALLASVSYRYIRVTPSKAETWAILKEQRERYNLYLPDFERLSRASSASVREPNDEPSKPQPENTKKHHQPDWNVVFRDIDLGDSATLYSRSAEQRKYSSPYDKEAFLREALARVRPGREPEFIRAVAAWPDFDFYDLRDLLLALPSPLPNRLTLRNAVREAVLSICRREPQRSQRRGWLETAPVEVLRAGGLVSYNEIAVAALEGVATQADRLDASELFQAIGPLSLILSAAQSEEVLEFGFDLLDEILRIEDGDGEWREELRPHGQPIDALAGYIWAGLGSAVASERWQHAHVIRAIVELGWNELLHAVIAMAGSETRSFTDHRLAFYRWHARQWLLIGLARGAIESPRGLRPAHGLLRESLGTKHIVIRELAAHALRTLVTAGELQAADIGDLAVNRPRQVLVYSGYVKEDDDAPESMPDLEDGDMYLFGIDIGPYWFASLGRTFGLSEVAIERRALAVVRQELGWSGRFGWQEDGRLARRIFDEGESSHDHGSLPRADDAQAYHAYHAMMRVAADLLEQRPVRRLKNERIDEFTDWMSRYMLTRTDGRWVADRRAPRLVPQVVISQEHWRWSVNAEYLDEQLITDDAMSVLWGEWQNGDGERYETISIRSALVSTEGAASLLAALQTAPKFDRYALPYATEELRRVGLDEERDNIEREANEGHEANERFEAKNLDEHKGVDEDDDIGADDDLSEGDGGEADDGDDEDDEDDEDVENVDAGPLKLSGWLSHKNAESRLDEYDPWGERVPFPGPAPSREAASRLGLREREDGTVWETPLGGIMRAELWIQIQRSERRDENVSGERLSANVQLLRELLAAYPDRTLILSVEIRRHPSRYDRGDEGFDSYPQPYIRYYLMGANGVATPL